MLLKTANLQLFLLLLSTLDIGLALLYTNIEGQKTRHYIL